MNKKIAFVISSLDFGGAQRAVANLSLAVASEYDIDIILNNDRNVVYPYRGNIISLGIENPKNRDGLLFQVKLLWKRIIALAKLKRNNSYLAVISYLDSANVANILSGNKYCKTVVSVRTNVSKIKKTHKRCLIALAIRILYNRADKIVSISKGVERDLIQNHSVRRERIVTIYNCYDLEGIKCLSEENTEIKIDDQYINFVTMGRLCTPKGQWHLIRAFSEVAKAKSNVRLYILGEGELESYLRQLIDIWKLNGKVYLCGFVKNPYAVLRRMQVFIFPSIYEGFGNALLEAMAIGLPCISTDFMSGAREIMQDTPTEEATCKDIEYTDYGVLIPVPNGEKYLNEELLEEEKTMAKAMLAFMESKTRSFYSKKAIERSKMFGMNSIWTEWNRIIEQPR